MTSSIVPGLCQIWHCQGIIGDEANSGLFPKNTNCFRLFQVLCAEKECRAAFKGAGHSRCRQHAPCRRRMDDGCIVWDPESCATCLGLVSVAFEKPYPAKERRLEAGLLLKRWVKGFRKNHAGPFILRSRWRERLFPKSMQEAAWETLNPGILPEEEDEEPEQVSEQDQESLDALRNIRIGQDVPPEGQEEIQEPPVGVAGERMENRQRKIPLVQLEVVEESQVDSDGSLSPVVVETADSSEPSDEGAGRFARSQRGRSTLRDPPS